MPGPHHENVRAHGRDSMDSSDRQKENPSLQAAYSGNGSSKKMAPHLQQPREKLHPEDSERELCAPPKAETYPTLFSSRRSNSATNEWSRPYGRHDVGTLEIQCFHTLRNASHWLAARTGRRNGSTERRALDMEFRLRAVRLRRP